MIETRRPKLEILNGALIPGIIDEALQILEHTGIFVENSEALDLFREAGMTVDASAQRVHITGELVQDSLASTPPEIVLYDREGETSYRIGGDEIHFDPGSAAVSILDPETGGQRKPKTGDVIRFIRLTDILGNLDFQSTGLISSDVPDMIADSFRLFIGLQYSRKPIVTGTFRTAGFQPMHDMLVAVRGSEQGLKDKPLAIFDACPSPPLKWSDLTTQSLIDCARAGIPSELISMGMTGATSPVTITGTLVQHVAENLAGLVICQLAGKGAPVIFGGSPSSFDMRKGTTPMGAIETMMIDSAYAQIGKHLNLPTHAYMALSDAKVLDSQAGLETGIGAVIAALSGINVISGPGMLDFESCQSLEKLFIDNEICGMAYRLVRGISQRESPMAVHLFEDFQADSHFLSLPHTLQWYREEHTYPRLFDRDTYDTWKKQGSRNLAQKAGEEVRRLLDGAEPALPGRSVRDELKKIMLRDAESNGISDLPSVEP